MFFDGWSGLVRLVAVGLPAYIALIVLLRISGKRTLSIPPLQGSRAEAETTGG